MIKKHIFITTFLIFGTNLYFSLTHATPHTSPYAGQEQREIKTLATDDINDLQNGRGWGLAKAAELNGFPGPIHILQMKREIHLNKEQEQKIIELYEKMKQQAIPLGNRLIQLEKELNQLFANKLITDDLLREKLDTIMDVRKQLRFVHLSAHLQTPSILTSQQVEQYNQLRGYKELDPCKQIPKGHNPEMWRKHNHCR